MDVTLQDPLVGRVIDGRYLIESRIARGGMATVYLALDRRLDREVALKVLHAHLAGDEEFAARFVREARSAARLSHPNVVQVFDQGEDRGDGGDLLYLAMEYLPGRTLRDVLVQRGALTPRETVSVMEPVLGALGAAHRAGIVHRDVKPENVILTDDGRIKVADFGLARAASHPISNRTTTQLLGTVAYLAPELVSRGVADARADVYAAGILLFELLTGKQPFVGDDPTQVAWRHVREQVPAPTAIAPDLPRTFDAVVGDATDPDPDRRPPDADALLQELHDARDRTPAAELDIRAVDAATLQLDAARTQLYAPTGSSAAGSAPAAATAPQATRALAVPSRGVPPLLPRLKVHDDDGRETASTKRTLGITAIIGAAVLVLVVLGGVWWFTGGPGAYTSAPGLVGARETDAERTLQAQGLKFTTKQAFSTEVAAGQVIDSDPAGGEKVKKNGTVALTISKGPQLVAVPDLKGVDAGDAGNRLQAQQLELGATTERFSGSVDKGKIISTKPSAGSKVAPGRKVAIVVSKGVEPVQLINVVGRPVEEAKQLLGQAGLKVEVEEQDYQPGAAQPGTVYQQNPPVTTPGQTVDKGSTVTIWTTKMPEGQANVPDFNGQNFDQAKATLEGLGFSVKRAGIPFSNTVRSQSAVGLVPVGTEITLVVGF